MKKTRKSKVKKVIDTIESNSNFLITSHMNLEGDALGSELALRLLLLRLKKKVTVYNHDLAPEIYDFLPGYKKIKNKLTKNKFDVFFVLDCSDISRSGKAGKSAEKSAKVVNIDHHISNNYFGDINWVEPKMSSTCQMIYYLAKEMKLMDEEIALCLYTGILTDTGSFTYANTNSDTHKVITDLMKYGVAPHKISEKINSMCTFNDLKLIAKLILGLKFSRDKKICWVALTNWPKKSYDLTEVIFSMMRLLKGPQAFIIFKRVDRHKTRVNFRSRSDVIDVNKIAQFFGGGGHRRASGTTLLKGLKESERQVISFINKSSEKRKNKQ